MLDVEIKDDEDSVALHKRSNRTTKSPFGHCKASGWALKNPLWIEYCFYGTGITLKKLPRMIKKA